MSVVPECVSVCYMHRMQKKASDPHSGQGSPEEQLVLLTTEAPLQPRFCSLCTFISLVPLPIKDFQVAGSTVPGPFAA